MQVVTFDLVEHVIRFEKMHGSGNDFILLKGGQKLPDDRAELAHLLCDRHRGIGSDGLIVVEESEVAHYRMDFYNPDGSQSFCGNGSRCAYAFARKKGMVMDRTTFEAIDGVHQAMSAPLGVRISMADTSLPEERVQHWFLDTGSPHLVVGVADVDAINLKDLALPLRHHEQFTPGGTNVNVVAIAGQGIRMRTFERGVEDETLACGTGVTAAALVYANQQNWSGPVRVETPGGLLEVSFDRSAQGFTNVWLEGPVAFVFSGSIDLQKLKG